ncbi:WD repeat-containing protein 88-like [Buteo buteo]|uniref:WD repeat-containing protein 88-like n=1 Tax=Buteo buteo TaxID=30397 RepID=UPI003EBE99F4
MAAGSSRGDPLALGPSPSPAEGRWEDRELRAQIQFKILRGHSDTVSSCHFCFEDTKILSCSYDRTVKLWDVEKGFPIQVFEEEHTAPISECNLTPDDRRMITSSYDNTVKAWDMETGKIVVCILLNASCRRYNCKIQIYCFVIDK